MARQSLAVKYRPKTWDDVVEQSSAVAILKNQLETGEIKHAYLFCGGAGTGKTTCARIFANEINQHKGNPIELDAASNNSVDDVRNIIQQSKVQSMDSEYRIWIIDECHALSNNAWQAFLKILEEPPKKAIFIFCTTDPQKIPKTILSRVQRYDFQRISQLGIQKRLSEVLKMENSDKSHPFIDADPSALEYIAKLADGGMRDALTMMDKCLAFSEELQIESVVKVLGVVDYSVMFDLTNAVIYGDKQKVIEVIEKIHSEGKDLKLFTREYLNFVLDVVKYDITQTFTYMQLPSAYAEELEKHEDGVWFQGCQKLLEVVLQLVNDVKWDSNPKMLIESRLILFKGV